ncbi:Clavaminate synthase-like protein [Thermothelomyces heterothallicus CBS 203.75]
MDKAPRFTEGHPMSWTSNALATVEGSSDAPGHVYQVGKQGADEVDAALGPFRKCTFDAERVTRETFVLPTVQAQLARASLDVHEGRGFAIVRALDPQRYTAEENLTIFLGISNYIGEQRGVQDKMGSMLTHVTDSKVWTTPPEMRHGIHTTTGLAWHCDMGADVLALHVRSLPKSGGSTFVASSWTIYRELAESYPTVLEALCDANWPIQVSGNPPRYIVAPLLHVSDDKILISVDPGRLGLHPATAKIGTEPPVPALSQQQLEALGVLSALATKHRFCLDLKLGDIVFINNLALLHARDPYIDPANGPGRHLVRLWLRNPKLAWTIPQAMRTPWEAAFGPNGEGFPGLEKRYPVEPSLVYKPPKYTAGSAAFVLEDGEDVNAEGYI